MTAADGGITGHRERGSILQLPLCRLPKMRLPQPIPYQGSKRLLAPRMLDLVRERRFRRLYEPCAGSAAFSLAAAARGLATEYRLSDSLPALVAIWQALLDAPEDLANAYARLWYGGLAEPDAQYYAVRERFNAGGGAAEFLYLLARCVKSAPRFNRAGHFNQSPDRRRRGAHPSRMRRALLEARRLLHGRTTVCCTDFEAALADATAADLVYLDPPYHGTSTGRDRRYHQGVERARLLAVLRTLDRRGVPYLLSYDGRRGEATYGPSLAEVIAATRIELVAGRSAQATLLGRHEVTVESLYVAHTLTDRGDTQYG